MKKVVIFDDSISYFTNPAHIQAVYGRFWDEGIPISLAITPALRGDVRSIANNKRYKASIPHDKHGDTQPFKVSKNDTLCRYLNVMAEQRLVEICLHGYNGTIDEFKSDDDILLGQKIEEGKAELQRALPDAEIGTFVIPEIRYSKTAINLLTEYDFRICVPHKPKAKSEDVLFNTKNLSSERKLFTYSANLFSSSDDTLDLQGIYTNIQVNDLIIIRQHYSAFYDDNSDKPNKLIQQWQIFIQELLLNKDLEFDTFMFV